MELWNPISAEQEMVKPMEIDGIQGYSFIHLFWYLLFGLKNEMLYAGWTNWYTKLSLFDLYPQTSNISHTLVGNKTFDQLEQRRQASVD